MRSLLLKLFLVLLATVAAVVVTMLLLMRWSFDRGFLGYLDEVQRAGMEEVALRLEAYYASHRNWDEFVPGNETWRDLTRPDEERASSGANAAVPPPPRFDVRPPVYAPGDGPGMRPPPPQAAQGPTPPPFDPVGGPVTVRTPGGGAADPLDIGPRLTLFDADGRAVIGRARSPNGLVMRPLMFNGQQVGLLALTPMDKPQAMRDARFLQQQRRDFYWIALLVVAMAGVAALLLARRLLKPVHALAGGARRLAAGAYDTRVTVASNDELGELAGDFNQLAETLQANESARRRWIADISHELRTPIAVLRGEIEALQDGVRAANASTIDSLHGEAVHLGKLVEDLYQLAISDQGALTYHKHPTDVVELLERLLDGADARCAEAGLALERDGPRAPVLLLADPNRLTQLLHNLVTNAIRYTDRGGRVVFAWRVSGARFVLDVQDTAPGVPADALPRLFERLYRVEASRNRARGGAGLGLAIVKAIIEAHHGIIDARPSPLGGLWLHMELPILNAEENT